MSVVQSVGEFVRGVTTQFFAEVVGVGLFREGVRRGVTFEEDVPIGGGEGWREWFLERIPLLCASVFLEAFVRFWRNPRCEPFKEVVVNLLHPYSASVVRREGRGIGDRNTGASSLQGPINGNFPVDEAMVDKQKVSKVARRAVLGTILGTICHFVGYHVGNVLMICLVSGYQEKLKGGWSANAMLFLWCASCSPYDRYLLLKKHIRGVLEKTTGQDTKELRVFGMLQALLKFFLGGGGGGELRGVLEPVMQKLAITNDLKTRKEYASVLAGVKRESRDVGTSAV